MRAPAYASRPSCGHPFCPLPYRLAVGVGNNEAPTAFVRRSDVGSSNDEGTGSIAESLEIVSHEREPPTATVGDVFDNDEPRPEFPDDAPKLVPEAGSLPGEPGSVSCDGDVLAGEAAADEVNGSKGSCARESNIRDAPIGIGPVPRKYAPAEVIRFHLPDHVADAGPFEAEFQAADAGEEGAHPHGAPPFTSDAWRSRVRRMICACLEPCDSLPLAFASATLSASLPSQRWSGRTHRGLSQ